MFPFATSQTDLHGSLIQRHELVPRPPRYPLCTPSNLTASGSVEVVLVVNGVDAQPTGRRGCLEPAVVLVTVSIGIGLDSGIASVGHYKRYRLVSHFLY